MKAIILLFSFMFVSCVTANTGERDLSAVNTAEGENTKTAFNWKFWEKWKVEKKQREQTPEQKQRKYDICKRNCPDPCSEYRYKSCMDYCFDKYYSKKEGVKVASIGDQNPFNLLEEAQNNFEHLSTEDNNHEDKAPLMLAVDYDCCVKLCIDEGGSSSECHRGCEE